MDRTLQELCERWRTLTRSETEGIEASNWAQVEACQEAKRALQPLIMQAADGCYSGRRPAAETKAALRRLFEELMVAEASNRDLIAARQQEAERQLAGLQRASRSLRQLHKAYAGEAGGHWHSYS